MGALKIFNLFKKEKNVTFDTLEKVESSTFEINDSDDLALQKDDEIRLLKKKLSLLEDENNHLKSNLTTIQSNLSQSVSNNRDALEQLDGVDSSFDSITDESKSILHNISNLRGSVEETSRFSNEIEEGTSLILGAIESIADIAMQSKLLSFNASVEAARAGEAGKGFSVVAAEVQRLSNSTSELLDSIRERTSSFGEIAQKLKISSSETLDTASSVIDKVTHFNEMIDDTNSKNKVSVKKVHATNDEVFMSLAKLDHIIWKVNTYISIIEEKEAFKFVDHHNCRLGKWYFEGEGMKNFSHLSSFSILDEPHSRVHNGTKKIFDYLHNTTAHIEDIVAGVNEMESASNDVFDCLDEILQQKNNSR